jgi:hypothetical protein
VSFFDAKLSAIKASPSQTSRTPFDVAADALARLRGALVPEMDLAGFGGDSAVDHQLEERLELFYSVKLDWRSALEVLSELLRRARNQEQPPKIT